MSALKQQVCSLPFSIFLGFPPLPCAELLAKHPEEAANAAKVRTLSPGKAQKRRLCAMTQYAVVVSSCLCLGAFHVCFTKNACQFILSANNYLPVSSMLPTHLQAWVARYSRDQTPATSELLTFLVQVCCALSRNLKCKVVHASHHLMPVTQTSCVCFNSHCACTYGVASMIAKRSCASTTMQCHNRAPQAAGVSHTVSVDEVEEGDADELASRLRAMVMEVGCDAIPSEGGCCCFALR